MIGTALVLASVSATALAVGPGELRVGINTAERVETMKAIPISREPWRKPRVVATVSADDLGPVHQGDTVEGFGEVEVSVTCLEAMPQCVGSIYRYSPDVKARFVLGDTARSAHGYQVGSPVAYECSQDQPNRNHHCVVAIHRGELVKSEPSCGACHLNLVLTAFHPGARSHDRLVLGADGDDGIHQGKASVSGVVFGSPPASFARRRLLESHQVINHRLPVDDGDAGTHRRVIGSVRMPRLHAGEALLVDAKAKVGIRHLGYNALLQSQLIISRKRNSIQRSGQPIHVISWNGRGDAMNGFNCTRGPSGYDDPCPIHKVAAFKVLLDARAHPGHGTGRRIPLFLNLISGSAAELEYARHWRRGDVARVRGVRMRVWRYPSGG